MNTIHFYKTKTLILLSKRLGIYKKITLKIAVFEIKKLII